ncbi:hypothetical protein BN2475_70010 [Paraburkholderia ribeironis]|uniref:Uncharacterized protein n=1 Tax=Paraburkholderia ribeironis TaxID=1247936 RepID=A0A1N7RLI2_9BURK|nr:hypothetical protein [Paraburkholderia ribeironis]SIT35963.1 hypothetical protein BN2475_70010 [Paraburkholderia ribeironis]
MFDSIKRLIRKWRVSRDGGHQLDALLAIADRNAPYPERSVWLIELGLRHRTSATERSR